MQGSERADMYRPYSERCSNHYTRSLDSELNLMKNPFIEQNQHDKLQNHRVNEMISSKESSDNTSHSSSQPTMRLMGKDVPIGRSSNEMQQLVEGNVWGADESRRRHYSEDVALANSLLERCSKQDWISSSTSQLSTENVTRSVKIQSNQALQSTLLMNGQDSQFPRPFINLQTNYVSQNGSFGDGHNASSRLHPITHASSSSSCAVFNREPDLSEQFICGAKPLGLSSQLQVLPTPCNFSQRTCLSNGELHDRKKLPQVAKSAFEFPFLHPGIGEHAKTSWFERSHRSLPPWLLTSTHDKSPGTSQQFSGPSCSFPQNIWGCNFTTPSVNHSAEVVHSKPLTSHCQTKSPLYPASFVQPAPVPVVPATKPAPTINSGSRSKIKVTDKMVLDDMTAKDHQPFKNTQKRPTANLDNSAKPIELRVHENSSRMIGLTQKKSSNELQQNPRAVQRDPHGDDARNKCCCQNEPQSRSYPGMDSFKLDGMVMPGGLRLSPGAKPILKPCQSTDQDNSRPNHSAIPMKATSTDRVRDVEIQRKLTKIYRF
ncbi:hypothetical protein L6164_029352 [Bauhinia variegata]|nr:hypothetical protein L6164_029352 [Bauhinia variegata]